MTINSKKIDEHRYLIENGWIGILILHTSSISKEMVTEFVWHNREGVNKIMSCDFHISDMSLLTSL